ncbi:hypothetical protein HCU74_08325 [Spongiibacter sp. KMU-166]|uniref:Uncharacterized protein n=1 Tax=Spongiibacter thalassae TaxID=2721624 RepID=A0ABX1GE35_9GAMM|nr:hypothetical protein [Spongiibacter thalassae]NKI17421.1 hypothetical protein [Spongiibacter thalassae]
MTSAEKPQSDYSEYQGFLRFVLSVSELRSENGLADWINNSARSDKHYTPRHWRKPGEHCVHAVATKRGGGSGIPLEDVDFLKSRYVHVINSLPAPYPDQLRGRCAPNPSVQQVFSIINPILDTYREMVPKARAAAMLNFELRRWDDARQGPKPHIRTLFEHTRGSWPDSKERKAWDEVKRKLREELRPATTAWVEECRRRGLEI